jgi:hypothetical protein
MFSLAMFGLARFGIARFGLARFGFVRFGLPMFGWLGLVCLGLVWLDLVWRLFLASSPRERWLLSSSQVSSTSSALITLTTYRLKRHLLEIIISRSRNQLLSGVGPAAPPPPKLHAQTKHV